MQQALAFAAGSRTACLRLQRRHDLTCTCHELSADVLARPSGWKFSASSVETKNARTKTTAGERSRRAHGPRRAAASTCTLHRPAARMVRRSNGHPRPLAHCLSQLDSHIPGFAQSSRMRIDLLSMLASCVLLECWLRRPRGIRGFWDSTLMPPEQFEFRALPDARPTECDSL